MTNNPTPMYTVTPEVAHELRELMEDTVAQFCQENMISGELAWLMAGCVAEAKTAEFKEAMR